MAAGETGRTGAAARSAAIDHEALARALRALGMHAEDDALRAAAGGARDEAEAIRAYILRERAHLLSCYELEALVALVQSARAANSEPAPMLESYAPA